MRPGRANDDDAAGLYAPKAVAIPNAPPTTSGNSHCGPYTSIIEGLSAAEDLPSREGSGGSRKDGSMRKSRHTEEQIAMALRQGEAATPVSTATLRALVSEATAGIDHPHRHADTRLRSVIVREASRRPLGPVAYVLLPSARLRRFDTGNPVLDWKT